jgi:hypothetical protein
MPQICFQCDDQDYNEIVIRSNETNLSKARVSIDLDLEGNPEMEKLQGDLEHCQEIVKRQDEDIGFLRLTVSQRLLPKPPNLLQRLFKRGP